MSSKYSPNNEKSSKLRFHTQVAGVSLTAQQPLNNVARVTIQALAAVCGGTQSLHTNSYDEAIGLPTEESATIALRTQQIIAHESGAADVVDPLGGSHYVEYLTQEIYDGAMDIINTVEAKGGAMEAIKQGWQQQEIHNSAYKHLNDVESGERKIVGVNLGEMEELNQVSAMKVDAKLGDMQTAKLKEWRDKRDNILVDETLDRLSKSAKRALICFRL